MKTLHLADPKLARGVQGSFESWADPNTLLAVKNADIEGCCINGGMRGLFLASQNAIHETDEEIRVNLLISAASSGLEVASHLPYEGRLDLYAGGSKQIRVRTPDWLRPNDVRVDGPAGLHVKIERSAVCLKGVAGRGPIVLRFEQPETERTHMVAGLTYRALWRGDTVIRLLPQGGPYPIYQRAALKKSAAPSKVRDLLPVAQRVHW